MSRMASIPTGRGSWGDPLPFDHRIIIGPLRDVVRLLRQRPDFLRFEAAFMIYGVAFMMLMPVVPLYLVDDLRLSYATIGLARGTVCQLFMIIAIFIFGRWFDRSTPHRMAVSIFLLLAFYPLALLAALPLAGTWRDAAIYMAFAVFGVAMSGITVLWSLSSLRFSGGEDAGVYQSVHVAATGLRGMTAPLLGYMVMIHFGKPTAFIISSVLWVTASAAMVLMRKIDIRRGQNRSLRAT